jgi:hypothetical protein
MAGNNGGKEVGRRGMVEKRLAGKSLTGEG